VSTVPCATLQAILSSKDEYLITVLYSTLVGLGADADLLKYHGPGLGERGAGEQGTGEERQAGTHARTSQGFATGADITYPWRGGAL